MIFAFSYRINLETENKNIGQKPRRINNILIGEAILNLSSINVVMMGYKIIRQNIESLSELALLSRRRPKMEITMTVMISLYSFLLMRFMVPRSTIGTASRINKIKVRYKNRPKYMY